MSRGRLAGPVVVALLAVAAAMPSPASSAPSTSSTSAAKKKCHPGYRGACLKRNAGDYDCAGGSGNGPNYVRGPIRVVGSDPFDLDRDGDGIACDT
jgi:uncharacterized membrane protein